MPLLFRKQIDLMDAKEAAVAIAKKVFTTANKSKTGEVKSELSSNEPKAPKTPKEPKEPRVQKVKDHPKKPKEVQNTQKPESTAENNELKDSTIKKKPRKRKPKVSKDLSKGIEELTIGSSDSPILSADAAPFLPTDIAKAPKSLKAPAAPAAAAPAARKPVARPKPNPEKGEDLRSIEIKQLQIRFSPTGFTMTNISDDVTIQCVMPITDPDFAYDLDSLRLEIILPRGYPGNKSIPIRPTFSLLNSDIPSAIINRIERNLKWGLNSLEGGVLVCRPMLRYLEDNLEKWMVDDVRESAFKFVKASEIKVTQKEAEIISEEEEEGDEEYLGTKNYEDSDSSQSQSQSRYSKGDWIAPPPISDQSSVGGTPFTLKLLFTTIRGIDLLTSQKVSFLACCDRCKFNFPVEELRPFVDRIEHCPKCTNQSKFYYKSQLVTPGANFEDGAGEFEGILGSVRFLRAKPVDLLPSLYQSACSRCFGSEGGEDASSSCKIEKVKIGENISYSCFGCHQKIRFQIDRIEWINDGGPASASGAASKAKIASGPALSVGNPLPNTGACEHYKKSFRWYRFPCCGQAFPCDECHARDPVAKAHPVEWANRFICGFCSREQSINIKECPECGKNTSASGRKATSFWEGGKGARNQILMSRKDSKKYKDYGTPSKTVLKKKPKKAED